MIIIFQNLISKNSETLVKLSCELMQMAISYLYDYIIYCIPN